MSISRHLAENVAALPGTRVFWRRWFGPAAAPGKVQWDGQLETLGACAPDKTTATIAGTSSKHFHGGKWAPAAQRAFFCLHGDSSSTPWSLVRFNPADNSYTVYDAPSSPLYYGAMDLRVAGAGSEERVYVVHAGPNTTTSRCYVSVFKTSEATPVLESLNYYTGYGNLAPESIELDASGAYLFVAVYRSVIVIKRSDMSLVTGLTTSPVASLHSITLDPGTDDLYLGQLTGGAIGKIYKYHWAIGTETLTQTSYYTHGQGVATSDDMVVANGYLWVPLETSDSGLARFIRIPTTTFASHEMFNVAGPGYRCDSFYLDDDGLYLWMLHSLAPELVATYGKGMQLTRYRLSDGNMERIWFPDHNRCEELVQYAAGKYLVTNGCRVDYDAGDNVPLIVNFTNPFPDTALEAPSSGSKYSYWASLRPYVEITPDASVSAPIAYTDGANGLGTGWTAIGGIATDYDQPTGTEEDSGDVLNTTNYPTLEAAPVDIFGWTSGSPKVLDGSLANPDTGDVGVAGTDHCFLVIQLVAGPTVAGGLSATEVATLGHTDGITAVLTTAASGVASMPNVIVGSLSILATAAVNGVASLSNVLVLTPFVVAASSGVASLSSVIVRSLGILAAAASNGLASLSNVLVLTPLFIASMSGVASFSGVAVAAPATTVSAPVYAAASLPAVTVSSPSILAAGAAGGVASLPNVVASSPSTLSVTATSGIASVPNVVVSTGGGTAHTVTTDLAGDGYLATRTPLQRKLFWAADRFWIFYKGVTAIVFQSSTDGITWSSATTVHATGLGGAAFSLCFDGTYLHYGFNDYDVALVYRRGLPNSDGTITWSDEQPIPDTSGMEGDPSIIIDSNGYPWVAGLFYPTGWKVYKSSKKDGTWETANSWMLHAGTQPLGELVALTGGKVYCIYYDWSEDGPLHGKLYDGSTWGSQENVATSYVDNNYYSHASAVAIGDDVHVAFLKKTSRDVVYVKRTYGVGWGSEETVLASGTLAASPVISYDTASGDIYVFWTNTPTVDHVFYRLRTASAWATVQDWIDETAVPHLYTSANITCFPKTIEGRLGVAWTTYTHWPFNVRHASLLLSTSASLAAAAMSGVASLSNVTVSTSTVATIVAAASNGVASMSNVVVGSLSILAAAATSGVASLSNVLVLTPFVIAASSGVASLPAVIVQSLSVLAVAAVSGVASLSNVTVTAATAGAIVAAATSGAASLSNVALTAASVLTVAAAGGAASLSNVIVGSLSILAVAATSGVASVSNVTITAATAGTIVAAAMSGVASVANVAITAASVLTAAAASGAASLSSVIVSSPSILTVAATNGIASLSNVTVTTASVAAILAVGAINGAASLSNVIVCSLSILAVGAVNGTASLSNVTLMAPYLIVAAASGVASVSNVVVSSLSVLAVAASSGSASLPNVTVSSLTPGTIVAAATSGIASMANVALTAASILTAAATSGAASLSNVIVQSLSILAVDATGGLASLPNVIVSSPAVGTIVAAAFNGTASVSNVVVASLVILAVAAISGVAALAVVVLGNRAAVIDLTGSYEPTVNLTGSYEPEIDLEGSYE